ncbi:hypothetical protein Cgig2_016440 [Carnegiea gigantea]|uniref:Cystatin domain-containing protein n=1 Tax=Carnegiea gigantea TaxID=171969 RepID=A0A9Q1QD38_9CARY|nr:hypothetical protein Cgig2_016440 [Carnegiea gigantea]
MGVHGINELRNCKVQKQKGSKDGKCHPSIPMICVPLSLRANAQRKGLVGGRTEIKDVTKNKEVQDLGRFSVEEYNRSLMEDMPPSPLRRVVGDDGGPTGHLMFLEVVEAQRQVVAGLKYYLKVAAVQDGVPKTFDAVVVVKPWEAQSKKLLNFGPSHN